MHVQSSWQTLWKTHYMQTLSLITFSFLFSIFLVVGIELRASHMLGKCSTTELYPQPDWHIFENCLTFTDLTTEIVSCLLTFLTKFIVWGCIILNSWCQNIRTLFNYVLESILAIKVLYNRFVNKNLLSTTLKIGPCYFCKLVLTFKIILSNLRRVHFCSSVFS